MNCPKCNEQIGDEDTFCPSCGEKIGNDESKKMSKM